MSGWFDLKNFILYLPYLPLHRISLLTYYFSQGCQAQLTSNKLLFVSHSDDFGSGFWHWKWLFEGVTHSSTSPILLSYLAKLTSDRGFDTGNDIRKRARTWVLAKNIFLVSRLVDFRIEFGPPWRSPQVVTRSSTSRKLFFLVSRLIDLWIGFWPELDHPKWSPGRVLAHNFCFVCRSVDFRIVFWPP